MPIETWSFYPPPIDRVAVLKAMAFRYLERMNRTPPNTVKRKRLAELHCNARAELAKLQKDPTHDRR